MYACHILVEHIVRKFLINILDNMSEFKYKIGDKVRIKSIDWYNKYKDKDSGVLCGEFVFLEDMKKFCSEILTIQEDVDDGYLMLEDNHGYVWTDEMFECLVERNGKTYPYKIGDRVILKGSNKCATITDLKYNSFGNLSYYIIEIDNDINISTDCPTELLLPYDNNIEGGLIKKEIKPKFKVGDVIISDVFSTKDDKGWIVTNVERTGYKLVSVNNSDLMCDMDLKNEQYYKLVEEKSPSKFRVGDVVYSKTWQRNVIIQEILPAGFYKVEDPQGLGWFTENEVNICKEKITLPIDSHVSHASNSTKILNNEIKLPEGYVFKDENGNEILTSKIILEKKKTKYPKTYEECIGKLPINWDNKVEGYKGNLLTTFQKLLICLDTYWKIAGEEMGLDGPWKPDYTEESYEQGCPIKYVIYYTGTEITTGQKCTPHYKFSFPTAEMRDAFKENFDSDLELCKELL